MSFLRVELNRMGGGSKATMKMVPRNASASMTRVKNIKMSLGLVCGTNLGKYEILWSSTDALITLENDKILVRKRNV